MKNKVLKYLTLAALVVGLTLSTQATLITGGISFDGGYTVDTGVLGTANAFSTFSTVTVSPGPVGSYVGTAGQSVTMSPFSFASFSPVTPLWTFTTGGNTYSFDLTVLSIDKHTSSTLELSGTGTLHITGFDDTASDWVFTANSLGGTFSFSSSNGAVPDGGATMLLLGATLSSLALIRRKHA
jgi:hypothetical protein